MLGRLDDRGKRRAEYFTAEGDYVKHSTAAKLARLLDSAIPLPGGFRIGLDGIIGLIPGVGDTITSVFSLLILQEAYKRRVPKMILVRMLLNVLIDALVGAVPVLGDIFDFFWKANMKNVRLLEDYSYAPERTYKKATFASTLMLAATVAIFGLMGWLAWQLGQLLWSGLTTILNS